MAFIVPSGKHHDIFEKEWAVIRFVTVKQAFGGLGIGKKTPNFFSIILMLDSQRGKTH